MAKVLMFARFERFWHWSQAGLIITLLYTGFSIHGSVQLLSFEQASKLHHLCAWALLGLWVLAWFWHLTTGEWKQYIPSAPERLFAMIRFYAFGIFQGKKHPFHKDRLQKHNPLQRMAYLSLHLLIGPAIWVSGLSYLFFNELSNLGIEWLTLPLVAMVHTAAAFLMLTFLIAHLYLAITMSSPIGANVKAMITGYEDIED